MARKKFSEEQKTALLAKFERWDGSAASFCRKQRLSYQTLRSWRLRAQNKAIVATPAEFVEVEVELGQGVKGVPKPVAELDLGAGVVLRVFPVQGRS